VESTALSMDQWSLIVSETSRAPLSRLLDDLVSVHNVDMPEESASRTARSRVRAELIREITDTARRQLTETGAQALSLRAVARELGMASSAMYRYFPSRNELLTALIVDAYSGVADAAQDREAAVRRSDLAGRWMALTRAVRGWALTHRQEYELIFGSPVPGYRAPADTVDPAGRIPILMLGILSDAVVRGLSMPTETVRMPRPVRADFTAISDQLALELPEHYLGAGVMAWSQLIGLVSFELFGHLHNAIHDYDAHFDYQMRVVARELGLG
jgi:AcrR family transcriptional regulator